MSAPIMTIANTEPDVTRDCATDLNPLIGGSASDTLAACMWSLEGLAYAARETAEKRDVAVMQNFIHQQSRLIEVVVAAMRYEARQVGMA